MDEFGTVDELETNPVRKRSAFLTVLCILTWIYSAFLLCWVVYAIFNTRENPLLPRQENNASYWYLIHTLSPIFCAVGAVFMWMLNRWGFFLYLIGQLAPVILSFYTAIALEGIQGPSLIFTILGNSIPIGFLALYAINLPAMKKK